MSKGTTSSQTLSACNVPYPTEAKEKKKRGGSGGGSGGGREDRAPLA